MFLRNKINLNFDDIEKTYDKYSIVKDKYRHFVCTESIKKELDYYNISLADFISAAAIELKHCFIFKDDSYELEEVVVVPISIKNTELASHYISNNICENLFSLGTISRNMLRCIKMLDIFQTDVKKSIVFNTKTCAWKVVSDENIFKVDLKLNEIQDVKYNNEDFLMFFTSFNEKTLPITIDILNSEYSKSSLDNEGNIVETDVEIYIKDKKLYYKQYENNVEIEYKKLLLIKPNAVKVLELEELKNIEYCNSWS